MELEDLTIKDIGIKTALQFIKLYNKKIDEAREKYNIAKKRLEEDYTKNVNRYIAAATEMRRLIEEEFYECPRCDGEGYIKEYGSMHDDRGRNVKCENCNGIGYIERKTKN